ncbi:MAG TPA: STAS domain-containing protein [Bryobacteraceae bacterium]|nr:STAS domain-containing protein [Bryobacteraceae bacterium]
MTTSRNRVADVLIRHEREIAAKWVELQTAGGRATSAAEQQTASRQAKEFLGVLAVAAQRGNLEDISLPEWAEVKDQLTELSAHRSRNGFTPTETAWFVFSLKQPLFSALRDDLGKDADALAEATWQASKILDKLGLFTTEVAQKSREDIISRQQQELLELSTPVVRLWENVLALPLIGTLDSARTQIVMQNLLDAIVQTRSDFAIIDITGVPVVDTLVAQHLLKTVAAARLMGADCVISGIRPQIAQTIIHLGVDLSDVTTKATLADAFALILRRSGQTIVREERGRAAER